jgi:hypothetical protein
MIELTKQNLKNRSKAVSNNSYGMLIKKCVALSFLSLALAGCATPTPTLDTGPNAEITFDGLHAVQNSAADKAWAIPGLDLSGYNKIMFEGAGIEFRPGGEAGRTSVIRAALLDVVSYVPPETTGRSEVYLTQIGAVTLVLEIHDSITDAILVRAIDRSSIGDDSMMKNSNRVTNTAEVRRVIRRWSSTLRERLDSFSGFENTAE